MKYVLMFWMSFSFFFFYVKTIPFEGYKHYMHSLSREYVNVLHERI